MLNQCSCNILFVRSKTPAHLDKLLANRRIDILSNNMENTLTRSQQTGRVAFLGVAFLIMFTAYNSLQNIVSKIYAEYGYDSLGETSILLLYFVFGVSTFFTPYVIRRYGFKRSMFVSSLGYAVYEGAGLVIALWEGIPRGLGWGLVLFGAVLCGASASIIWVAQGAYISQVAGEARKTELFGLFWSLMMSSQIAGNLITTFVLGYISNVVYFLVLTVLGFASAFLFILLPDVSGKPQQQSQQKISVKGEVVKVVAIIKDGRFKYLLMYYFFPGMCVAFYATYLYKLIKMSIVKEDGEMEADYAKRVSFYSGLVFIALGASQALTGFVMNRVGEKFCKFKLAVVGTMMVEVAGFVSLLCYFLNNYYLCFAVSFLWGSAETFLQTNTGALIGIVFPGKVESYSVFRIIFAIGTVSTIVLNIALKDTPAWIFLTIVMTVQVLTTGLSTQIINLKQSSSNSERRSLIESQVV